MKSYVQGLITGGVFVFAFMVLIGASSNDGEVGRYQISTQYRQGVAGRALFDIMYETTIDTKTGEITKRNWVDAEGYIYYNSDSDKY
jgi:hypothetical protein